MTEAVADHEIIYFQQKIVDRYLVESLLLKVDYLVVSNGLRHYCCKMDYERQSYQFLEDIPDYETI